jgi:hypothetical protein
VESTAQSTAISTGAERALRFGLTLLLLGGTTAIALHDWLGLGGSDLDAIAGGYPFDAVVLAAGIACLIRARAVKRERAGWLLIGLGILCWGAGEVHWTVFILDNPSAPYPSLGDIGYLAFYPLTYAGLAMLVRARAHELDWRLWTDGLIAALGTAALGTAFVFDFVADNATGTPLQVATTLAYPLCDIGMLSMVVGVIALTGWRPGRTWTLLLIGLAAQVIADIAYTLQSTGWALPPGNWVDPIYLISAVFLGACMWQPVVQEIRPTTRFDGWRELMIPVLFAVFMTGLLVMQYFDPSSVPSSVLRVATVVAIIVRLAISVRENQTLLEQVRTDSLTGLSNRGRMQVDLETALKGATEEHPAMLLLFDLNGFKRYNDTFGHPAGDTLLVELGRALREAVGDDGTAYRIGGDAGGGKGPIREREGIRRERLVGSGDDPQGGKRAARGTAACRRTHVRAEGVAASNSCPRGDLRDR